MSENPLVHVITPFYNTEAYLAQCIESVVVQSYRPLRYTLLDNCSTDGSRNIADAFSRQHEWIEVIHAGHFVGQRQNYNRSLSTLTKNAKYCKIVEADNYIYPECISKMVAVAERHPSAAIIGAYYIYGAAVGGSGIGSGTEVIDGREACRLHLLNQGYSLFGAPTNLLYRADIVRESETFFDEDCIDEDTDACYRVLLDYKFAFVHQVLSVLRSDEPSLANQRRAVFPFSIDKLVLFLKYGRELIPDTEYDTTKRSLLRDYGDDLYDLIEANGFRPIVQQHRQLLQNAGLHLSAGLLLRLAIPRLLDYLGNPKKTIGRLYASWIQRRRDTGKP